MTDTGQLLSSFADQGRFARFMSGVFSGDGARILTGSWDNTLSLWDITTSKRIQRFEGYSSTVYSVGFTPDGKRIVSGNGDRITRFWDVESGALLDAIKNSGNIARSRVTVCAL